LYKPVASSFGQLTVALVLLTFHFITFEWILPHSSTLQPHKSSRRPSLEARRTTRRFTIFFVTHPYDGHRRIPGRSRVMLAPKFSGRRWPLMGPRNHVEPSELIEIRLFGFLTDGRVALIFGCLERQYRKERSVKLYTKPIIQNIMLILASLVIGLLFCEGMARTYAYLTGEETASDVKLSASDAALLKKYFNLASLASARRLEQPIADRYLSGIEIAKGVDRNWFDQLPAMPDRDPSDVDPKAAAVQQEYIKRGLFGPQSFYIWNEAFVRSKICDRDDDIFKNLPQNVRVFESPNRRPYPRYRFPANRTLPGGLKTNRYGFRGPDSPPDRSPNTIRIAFIGSSETGGNHTFPYSYPEYFGIWLGKWLAANGFPYRVEVLNAGREGIDTTDVAAILEQEALPLAPDYVIFFDGANQLENADLLIEPAARSHRPSTAEALDVPGPLPEWLALNSRLAKVLNDTYRLYLAPAMDDWRRPKYHFKFPEQVNETTPDVASADLPLALPGYLSDLKTMTALTRSAGVPFLISTTVWLDGSELEAGGAPDQAGIRALLKAMFWPLRSPEIRRLIDFSNRALRQFAKSNDIGLLDIAKNFPRDPNLFFDAYHMNPEGLKLLAWIGLQQFLPRLADDLRDGELRKSPPVSVHLPLTNGRDFFSECRPSAEALAHARDLSLANVRLGSDAATLQPGKLAVGFRAAPKPWDIARAPLNIQCDEGGGWIAVDIIVRSGKIILGILNHKGNQFITHISVEANDGHQTEFLPLDSFADAGDLLVRNAQDDSGAEGELQAIRVVVPQGKPTPPACPPAQPALEH
jgi:hypothetical protein